MNNPPVGQAFSGFWTSTAEATRSKMTTSKYPLTAIGTGHQLNLGATASSKSLDVQFISDPLWGAQRITGTVSGQMMAREFATTDNVNAVVTALYVINNRGGTLRGVLLTSGMYAGIDSNGEFVNNATHRSTNMFEGNTVTAVNALDGDRICLEVGYNVAVGGGTSPQATAKYGTSATDLPMANESQTSDGTPWFQFNHMNLRFKENMVCMTEG